MIIEPIEITENGLTFNQITYAGLYWVCLYKEGETQIKIQTDEESPQPVNSKTKTLLTGFGATTYQEMLDEIIERGLS